MELPKMRADISISVKDHPGVHYNYTGEVPKDVMDEFEKIAGNGLAKVSVAVDLSVKDFGTGASAMCSVTLSCGQDQASIDRAAALAAWAAKRFAAQYRAEAEQEIQNILLSRGQQPPLNGGTPQRPNYG